MQQAHTSRLPSGAAPHEPNADKQIRSELMQISEAARRRHPLLAHQDALGMAIFLTSCTAIVGGGWLYSQGRIPAWLTIVAAALFMSFLHELEHDLIHHLYFKDSPLVSNLLMLGVWLFRPSTVSPWVRRSLHLHHHKLSGAESDMEERAITLGEPFGVRRLLMMSDGMLSVFLRLRTFKSLARSYADAQRPASQRERQKILWRNRLSYLPFGTVHFMLWHSFILLQGAAVVRHLLGMEPLGGAALGMLNFLVVVWLAPNMLRSFCLNFVSSNLHYYEDNEPKNVLQQTQVWTSPLTWPVQLFCCNFGGTHAIHHFVVREPFYVRQLVAKESQAVLRRHGARFNDFGTFRRNNRWLTQAAVTESKPASLVNGQLNAGARRAAG